VFLGLQNAIKYSETRSASRNLLPAVGRDGTSESQNGPRSESGLSPKGSIQPPVLDGFSDVLRFDRLCPFEVRDGAGYLNYWQCAVYEFMPEPYVPVT
jgi:hypothetical protein